MAIREIKNQGYNWRRVSFDCLLLFIAFFLVYFAKRGHFHFEEQYLLLQPVYFISWLISTLLINKFREARTDHYLLAFRPYVISVFVLAGLLSLSLYALNWYNISRFILYGSLCLYFFLEVVFFSEFFSRVIKKGKDSKSGVFPLAFFSIELILWIICLLTIHFYKRGTFWLDDDYRVVFAIICFSWFISALLIHRFNIPNDRRYLRVIWPFIKAMFITVSIVSFFTFGFRITQFSRLIVFGSLTGFACLEFLLVTIYYVYSKPQGTDEPAIDFFKVAILGKEKIVENLVEKMRDNHESKHPPGDTTKFMLFNNKLDNVYLKKMPAVFRFIDKSIDLSSFDILTAEVISTGNPYNIEIIPENSLDIFVNLHELNDFRRINQYLIQVNQLLNDGGIFISKLAPIEKRRFHFLSQYPLYLANVLYVIDFIWKRAFPKLPFLQRIYFAFTKGSNRLLSMAEGLGRLYFCGFEVIALEEIDNFLYFIVKKVKEPSQDANPSYSPVFKMKRTGRFGVPIYVYKFRTMYPYSEYIQGFVTDLFGYGSKGKIAQDFRSTGWGKFLRRFWLDELPQLINIVRGDLSLVGVRPLSDRFLANYPDDLRKERMKYKPGCLPPYVAYKMQQVEEYIESERIYFAEKKKHPLWTDVKIFFLVIYNIVTNKIRSA